VTVPSFELELASASRSEKSIVPAPGRVSPGSVPPRRRATVKREVVLGKEIGLERTGG
jgi:hypothetical protein